MTFIKRATAIAAGLAMSATPIAASAATPGAKLPLASARAASPAKGGSKLGSDVTGSTLINIGILAALIVIVLVVVADDNNDSPNSP